VTRYAWNVPELRLTLVMTGLLAMFGFNHQVLIPALVDQAFHGDVGAYTLLYSLIGVGSVIGALSVARRREVDLRFLAGAGVAFSGANALLGLSPSVAVAAVAAVATGTAASLFVTGASALLQRRCAPTMRGRVMALAAMVVTGGLPVGGPIVGMIVDHAGPRAGIMVGSAAALLVAAIVVRHRRPRNVSPPLPLRGLHTAYA
jgi:MFS family permease